MILGGAILGVLLALLAVNTGLKLGGAVPREPWAARAALIEPAIKTLRPQGEGPFPAALLFSGCDGPRDNLDRWAAMLNDEGWAALIVDSHRPRGYAADPVWRLICAGQLLPGAERAGDVVVAMQIARQRPDLDASRIALIGASHGGWSVLEVLGLAARGRPPDGLSDWPGGSAEAALSGLTGVIALYPYCGAAARVSRRGWRAAVPVLMLLAEDDTVTGTEPCVELAERMAARGLPVSAHVYPDVTHGFDQQDRSALSTLTFDADATADALRRGRAVLGSDP